MIYSKSGDIPTHQYCYVEQKYITKARCGDHEEHDGKYLFTAVPIGDAYSEAPDEAKEFQFIQLDNGRITCQPTNRVLFIDKSFTERDAKWPTHLRPLEHTYHSE